VPISIGAVPFDKEDTMKILTMEEISKMPIPTKLLNDLRTMAMDTAVKVQSLSPEEQKRLTEDAKRIVQQYLR
jgi:hypothetical protein